MLDLIFQIDLIKEIEMLNLIINDRDEKKSFTNKGMTLLNLLLLL